MAYELFERTNVRVDTLALSIVPDGRIALNSAAARLLFEAGVKIVLLLWDKANYKVALKATTKGDSNGYAVSIAHGKGQGTVRAKSFIGHIGWAAKKRITLPAVWNNKERMLEASLPPEHFASERATEAKHKYRVV